MELFNDSLMMDLKTPQNWKDVVVKGVDILVKNKYATKQLAEEIFESTKKYGAYYVLEKGIALLHAPAGKYCIKPGASLILLAHNIEFNNQDKWARIIITLSAPDNYSHMKIIQEFGLIFTNKALKEKLLNSKNINDFKNILKI